MLSGKLQAILPQGQQELPSVIGNFTSLRTLDISNNHLQHLNPGIANLHANLIELNLSNNLLKNIPEVSALTRLLILDIIVVFESWLIVVGVGRGSWDALGSGLRKVCVEIILT